MWPALRLTDEKEGLNIADGSYTLNLTETFQSQQVLVLRYLMQKRLDTEGLALAMELTWLLRNFLKKDLSILFEIFLLKKFFRRGGDLNIHQRMFSAMQEDYFVITISWSIKSRS